MKVTTKVCCDVVCLVILSLTFLSACLAAPLDAYYPTDDTELSQVNPQVGSISFYVEKHKQKSLVYDFLNKKQFFVSF